MPWHDSVQIMDMTVENVDMMRQKWTLMWGYGEKLDTSVVKLDTSVVKVDVDVVGLDGDGEKLDVHGGKLYVYGEKLDVYGEKLDTDSILYAITYGTSARAALDDETHQSPPHCLPLIAVVTGYVPIPQGMMYNGLVRTRGYD